MNFGILVPIVAIMATAWVMVSFIHYKQGRGRRGQAGHDEAGSRDNARLSHENETLRLTVRRLEERMAVLETIATDPSQRTAREIEQLR